MSIRAAGVTPKTVYNRLKRGWSRERALSTPPRSRNISAEARARGLTPHTVIKRIKRGWTLDRALSTPHLRITGMTVADHARARGLEPDLVHNRIRKYGWSKERALSTPKQLHVGPPSLRKIRHRANLKAMREALVEMGLRVKVEPTTDADIQRALKLMGALPLTKLDQARKAGVHPATFHSRLRRGWSLKETLETPIDHSKAERGPNTITAQARAVGLKPATVYGRIRRGGWSLERALETPLQNGIAARARAVGLKPAMVHFRIHKGWSVKEALETPANNHGLNTISCTGARGGSETSNSYKPDIRWLVKERST